jgi:hypothetical protein
MTIAGNLERQEVRLAESVVTKPKTIEPQVKRQQIRAAFVQADPIYCARKIPRLETRVSKGEKRTMHGVEFAANKSACGQKSLLKSLAKSANVNPIEPTKRALVWLCPSTLWEASPDAD